MPILNELVVHPTLGICSITNVDDKSNKVTLTSMTDNGSHTTFPWENFEVVGIRKLISKKSANELMDSIYHPEIESFDCKKMNPRAIEQLIKSSDIAQKAFVYSYLLYQKYTKEKIGVVNETYLKRVEEILCEELSYVLCIDCEQMLANLYSNYREMVQ